MMNDSGIQRLFFWGGGEVAFLHSASRSSGVLPHTRHADSTGCTCCLTILGSLLLGSSSEEPRCGGRTYSSKDPPPSSQRLIWSFQKSGTCNMYTK